jgi:hypothetical protein
MGTDLRDFREPLMIGKLAAQAARARFRAHLAPGDASFRLHPRYAR